MVDKYDAPRLLADKGARNFHVMNKPSGSTCNLDCTYCFYLHKETLQGGPGPGKMSDETLEQFIQQYIDGVTGPEVIFTWQGGEPTLRGLPFYKRVVELQQRYAKPGQRIENDLQTNGTLLNDEWAAFLKEHRFLVGLSIDGPRELHDEYRVTKNRAPTFERVLAAARLLQRHQVPFNTLTCVNRINARRPIDVYRFLRDELGSTYIQFSPVVQLKEFETTAPKTRAAETLPVLGSSAAKPGTPDSIVTDWSVDAEDYGYFLSRVFDEWNRHDRGRIYVSQFETIVSQRLGLGAHMCVFSENCGKGVAIEHDGSVYSCDHFVYPEYKLGKIQERTLADMVFSREQVKFGYSKSETLPNYCKTCPHLNDCWGECPRNRLLTTPDGEPGLNYLCAGLKKFYRHAGPELDRIVQGIKQEGIHPLARV